jgi:glycosyltransferase involved in cell wall biosynthesis
LSSHLKISVITPSLNQGAFIERAIRSVVSQSYPELEYFVIDGGSTDGTQQILKNYECHLDWVSEPDRGQAEAINKGFRKATGEVLCWLNADDELMPGALHAVAAYFEHHPEAQFVYGDAEAIDQAGRPYGRRGNVKATTHLELVYQGDFIVQPAAFWRRTLMREVGILDESLRYCLDYEYWLRISKKYQLHYLPIPLARERFHAEAKTVQVDLRRIQEIETVTRQFGNPDIPRRFRAERSAVYLAETIRQLRSGCWAEAGRFGRLTFRCFSPSLQFFPHLLALFLGPRGVAWMRLIYNLLRNKLSRSFRVYAI